MDSSFCAVKVYAKSHGELSPLMCNTYRSDVEEGGETVFPAAGGNYSATPGWDEKSSACAKRGLSVKPKRGDALLFWSMRPDATLDPSSLHGKRSQMFSILSFLHSLKGECDPRKFLEHLP